MSKTGPSRPNAPARALLTKPERGERSIFQARAPMKEGSMKGTRNRSFIVSLNGRSVRESSQAKKTPMIVEKKVTPAAMTTEFRSAS